MPRAKRPGRKPRSTGAKPTPSLDTYLVRRRWKHRGIAAAVIAALALLAALDHRGLLLYAGDDMQRYDGRRVEVVHVIDGDTLIVDVPDRGEPTTRIRLWGIDTPELAKPDRGQPAEPYAKEAKVKAAQLAEGRTVTLALEPHRTRGDFGRILAYVSLPDGTHLAEHLLKQGLARFDARFQHRHYRRYRLLEEQAKTQNKGLWSQEQP